MYDERFAGHDHTSIAPAGMTRWLSPRAPSPTLAPRSAASRRRSPTLDNILKYDFDIAIPGHGPVSTKADVQKFKEKIQIVQSRTRDLIKQGVPKDQYLSKLKTDDLGWSAGPDTIFARSAAPGFYDELAKSR